MKRILAPLALLLCLLAKPASSLEPKRPKLVVAIMVDQFRADYLLRWRSEFKYGLAKLLTQGAVFTDAHLQHNLTITAVGHSTLLTGATPSQSGIVGNEWFDRATKQAVTSVSDDQELLVGGTPGKKAASPRRLLVSTLGDQIKMSGRKSKVIGISIKDRSAILPAGHMADGAYWFENESKSWVTSTYYRKDLPAWVKAVNDRHPMDTILTQTWKPVDGGKPFCSMTKGAELPFCGTVEATPWGNELIEELAEKALVGEQLGQGAGTDVLAVSFSSNDYVGHAKGPDSPEVHDITLRTDRLLGKLLEAIDKQVGLMNTVIVLSADHGVSPVPEVNQERKMPGGRLEEASLLQVMGEALAAKYGAGKWVEGGWGSAAYLDEDLIAGKKLNLAEVEEVAAESIRKLPHVYRVYTSQDLMYGRVQQDEISRLASNGFYRQRSPNLTVVSDPFYLFFRPPGTSHGTPFGYDTHVPMIFLGSAIKPGTYTGHVAPNDIAVTLAQIVGVEPPSGAIGQVRGEILRTQP